MGKKKGAKKAADDFWDEAGEDVKPNPAAVAASDDEEVAVAPARKSAFSAMAIEGDDDDDDEQEESVATKAEPTAAAEEDEGTGTASSKKKKGKKGKKGKQNDIDWDEVIEDAAAPAAQATTAESKAPEEGNLDDEFPDDVKPKKKKGQDKAVENEPQGDEKDDEKDDEEEADGGGVKILSKKEKEKLKKEKEKAKKKAQAAAKKAAAGGADEAPPAATAAKAEESESKQAGSAATAAEADDGDEEEAEGGASADKKKKKKKKKGAEKVAEPVAAAPKKVPAHLAALQAQIAAQKKAEQEFQERQEAERRRLEELERLEKEEEERKEAERLRRKEKERLKREQLRKEGKLLTPKQKAERAAQEAKREMMIASGQIKVEGLEKSAGAPTEKKKVVYDSRKKKKGPSGPPSKLAEPASASAPAEPKVDEEQLVDKLQATSISDTLEAPAPEDDLPDEWDAESEKDDVVDDWDAESEDDSKPPATAAVADPMDEVKASKPNGAAAASDVKKADASKLPPANNGKAIKPAPAAKAPAAKPASAKAAPVAAKKGAAPPPKKGAAAPVESSEEEDSDDSDDSEDDSDSDDDSSSDDGLTAAERQAAQKKAEAAQRRKERAEAAMAARSKDDLRSPICCIMGHVDTGKTSLLDKVRQTNVQEGEAGGITQQIGATYFPVENIRKKTAVLASDKDMEYKIPGLLVIDTPGHESFTNLRSRGSSLCNIAILVVDIMHGLEPQTLESIRLLRDKKTPFIVALNKVDRLYGWKSTPMGGFQESLAQQTRATINQFEDLVNKTIIAFAEQSLNAVLYYDNKNLGRNVSLVPTSAVTGEGIPDLLQLLVSLTQGRMSERLMFISELECTVLEVKVIEGHGTTMDVILSNGVLNEGDRIVVAGFNGPVAATIRSLLTPEPLKEMRVKGAYVHHKRIKASMGIKIAAPDLGDAVAGSRLLVCGPDDDEDELMAEVQTDLTKLLQAPDLADRGVSVQASTLGSLEALLEFLRTSKIPVSVVNIGPVHKKHVMKCATMLERAKELAVMLCFDVPVEKEAEKLAEEMGIRIFKADIIYHLFDAFTAYNAEMLELKRKDAAPTAVWPVRLSIIAAFAKRDPIILGCDIIDGTLRVGTPLAVVKVDPDTKKKTVVSLGRVTSLEINHKTKDIVHKKDVGGGVAVKIEHAVYDQAKMFGKHFDEKDEVVSLISRNSIDSLKAHFWDDVTTDEKKLIKKLKPLFDIP